MKLLKLKLPTGNTLHVSNWQPPSNKAITSNILMLHGIESHSYWFHEVAELLTKSGYSVWSYDRQGFGESDGPRGHMQAAESVIDEFKTIYSYIRENSHAPLSKLVGMSWGGMFLLYATIEGIINSQSTILLAPGIFPLHAPSLKELFSISVNINKTTDAIFKLPYLAHDFCTDSTMQQKIFDDPYRIKQLSANSCYITGKMQKQIKRDINKIDPQNFLLILPEEDSIIDLNKTKNLLKNITTITVENSKHSLIIDQPARIAELICGFN